LWTIDDKRVDTLLIPPIISGLAHLVTAGHKLLFLFPGSTGPLRDANPDVEEANDDEDEAEDGNSHLIVVLEGDHLKLTCAASGEPKPLITWSKGN